MSLIEDMAQVRAAIQPYLETSNPLLHEVCIDIDTCLHREQYREATRAIVEDIDQRGFGMFLFLLECHTAGLMHDRIKDSSNGGGGKVVLSIPFGLFNEGSKPEVLDLLAEHMIDILQRRKPNPAVYGSYQSLYELGGDEAFDLVDHLLQFICILTYQPGDLFASSEPGVVEEAEKLIPQGRYSGQAFHNLRTTKES